MSSATHPHSDKGDAEFPTHSSQTVERWRNDALVHAIDRVAEEVPVAMIYNGISHAVMLATPASLEQFGLGFSLSEGILESRHDLYDIEVVGHSEGIELQMRIPQANFVELKQRRRNLSGRTGCGLCGTESLDQVRRHPAPVKFAQSFRLQDMHAALRQLPALQTLQQTTGAVHAAAWVGADGVIRHIEEDVGRHNALDKLIGTLALHDVDCATGYAIVTSRASYEMVQKSAMLAIPMLVAVSAPTKLAIDLAQQAGVTLVGFARGTSHVIYAHPQRLMEHSPP